MTHTAPNRSTNPADRAMLLGHHAEKLAHLSGLSGTLPDIVRSRPELISQLAVHLPLNKGMTVVAPLFATEVLCLSEKLGWNVVRYQGDFQELKEICGESLGFLSAIF